MPALRSTVAAIALATALPVLAQDVIRVGAPLPITGPLSPEAIKQQRGYDLWAETANKNGGVRVGNRRLKVETRKGPRVSVGLRWVTALAGGAIMGYGARMARGCTSGQALSGGAVLSVGSFAFMFAVFGGAYALAYFVRKLWN